MRIVIIGDSKYVFGVPKTTKVFRIPLLYRGKQIKLKLRPQEWGMVYVRDSFGIRKWPLIETDDKAEWTFDPSKPPMGENLRLPEDG